jgi:DNA polymerase-3 subunit gamma/tau
MIVQTLGEVPAELQITPDRDARLAEQSGRVGPGAVARLLDLLAAALEATKNGSDARTQLELALVKAAAPAVDPSTQALLQRIERLEAALRGESPAPPSRPAPAPASAPESPAPPPAPAPEAPQPPSTPAPETLPPAASTPRAQPQPPAAPAAPVAPAGAAVPAAPVAPAAPAGAAVPAAPVAPAGPAVPAAPAIPAAPAAAVAVAVAAPVALELESLRAVWPAVLESVRASNALCAAVLSETRPVAVDGSLITVAFAPDASYLMRKADDDEYRACVTDAIHALTGAKAQVAYVLGEPAGAEEEPAAAPTDHEWVQRFVAEFDAEEIHPESEAS